MITLEEWDCKLRISCSADIEKSFWDMIERKPTDTDQALLQKAHEKIEVDHPTNWDSVDAIHDAKDCDFIAECKGPTGRIISE